MPLEKIVNGVKKLNDEEKIKNSISMKKHIDEIKRMGWKKFWKMNNKVFYLLGIMLIIIIVLDKLMNSEIIRLIKNDRSWAIGYFAVSTFVFTAIVIYMIHFTLTIGIKQDYNTNSFMRVKMNKLKGIDWKSAEEPFERKKKQ